jgi:hypothetical protein
MLVSGLGMGIGVSSLFQTVMAGVPHRDVGSGAGALQSFQQIGSALGIAVTGQIFFATLDGRLASGGLSYPAYVASLEGALIYEIAAFGLVAMLVFFLKTAAATPGGQGKRQDYRPRSPAVGG